MLSSKLKDLAIDFSVCFFALGIPAIVTPAEVPPTAEVGVGSGANSLAEIPLPPAAGNGDREDLGGLCCRAEEDTAEECKC